MFCVYTINSSQCAHGNFNGKCGNSAISVWNFRHSYDYNNFETDKFVPRSDTSISEVRWHRDSTMYHTHIHAERTHARTRISRTPLMVRYGMAKRSTLLHVSYIVYMPRHILPISRRANGIEKDSKRLHECIVWRMLQCSENSAWKSLIVHISGGTMMPDLSPKMPSCRKILRCARVASQLFI